MSTQDTVNQIINNAMQLSSDSSQKAVDAAQAAQEAAQFYMGGVAAPKVTATVPKDPGLVISDPSTDVANAFNSAFSMFSGDFQSRVSSFFSTYFPNFATLGDKAEQWIQTALVDGGTGMNPDAEAAMWQRGRDRVMADSSRAVDDAVDEWAARGFALPPGVLQNRVDQISQDGRAKIGDFNREATLKVMDVEIENARLAVQQSVQMRIGIISALSDYLRTMAMLPNMAADYARTMMEAKTRMWGAVSDYYRAEIQAADLPLRAASTTAQLQVENYKIGVDTQVGLVSSRVQAALGAANALGGVAAAALTSQNTMANVSYIENTGQ